MNNLEMRCESIDATVFSSDMLWDNEQRDMLKAYLGRWQRAVDEHEQMHPGGEATAADPLAEMEARKDAAYLERNQVVAALAKCFPSGVARTAIEGWSEDWHGCVYIDLPTGQASWHFHDSHAYLFAGLPAYTKPWDGHSTEEKYARLAALAVPGEEESLPPKINERDINRWQALIQERPEGPWEMGCGGSFDRTIIKPISDDMLAELADWLRTGYTPWNGRSMPLSAGDRQYMFMLYFSVQGLIARVRASEKALAAKRPVTQEWVHSIPMMQQTVLLAAIRGPDGLAKYGGGAKMLLRWFRRCILLSAMDGRVISDPTDQGGGSFNGPSLDAGVEYLDPWQNRMQVHVNDYLRQIDALPHHYQMHFMHAVEIVGYKHPSQEIRFFWHQIYLRLVNDFHLHPETEVELDERLGDTRAGWLKRADPATVE